MIFLIVASYFVVYSFGVICGKIFSFQMSSEYNTQSNRPESFLSKANKSSKVKVEIDERKFVTDIETESLEKKFDQLAKTSVLKDETLSANVSKLAALKKSKE